MLLGQFFVKNAINDLGHFVSGPNRVKYYNRKIQKSEDIARKIAMLNFQNTRTRPFISRP